MALRTRFFLDDLEIQEPQNWDSFQIEIVRDDNLHGIGFESSVGNLEFYAEALEYIDEQKATQGLRANIVFKAEQDCDNSGDYTILIEGRLDISQYKKTCGTTCLVSLPVQTATCEATLNNRLDQSVDLDSNVSQNSITPIGGYPQMGITIQLPTKAIDYKSIGHVDPVGDVEQVIFPDPGGGSEAYVLVRPEYIEDDTNINRTNLTGGSNVGYSGPHGIFIPISDQVLFGEDNSKCFTQPFAVTARLKGSLTMPGVSNLDVYAVVLNGEMTGDWPINDPNGQLVEQVTLGTNINTDVTGPFAFDFTMIPYSWVPKDNGADGITVYLALHQHPGAAFNGLVTFETETFFSAITVKACPPTPTKAYMLHEALSQMVENVTDGCMRVKSQYYGRTDSLPFSFDEDGCGGKRFITSGLKIRNAPAPADTFFANLTDIIVNGLKPIDNIGMGVEPDPTIPGRFLLRIEDLDFFYVDDEIFECLAINAADFEVVATKDYAIIDIGYKKWTTLTNFGLDEFNSDREYHTDIVTINNKIDLTSILVAGEYAIEVTREQQFADTSAADTTYDDETFIVCLKRLTYNTFEVEQGNVENAAGMFAPSSIINYRISPLRNLMRWYRSLANAYPTLTDSANKLYFSSGTGNLQASGQLADGYAYGSDFCKLEGVDIKESMDLFVTAFNDTAHFTPLWTNETIEFTYPMSVADYNAIKLKPYGYITYQCGNGPKSQGWIKDIQWTPAKGEAKITLWQRWGK